MKLEYQVVSLELSKELKEAGYPQKGLWWWVCQWGGMPKIALKESAFRCLSAYEVLDDGNKDANGNTLCDISVAPTVAELGEALPAQIKSFLFITEKLIKEDGTIEWMCEYYQTKRIITNTEANARASMWFYLKKEGLL